MSQLGKEKNAKNQSMQGQCQKAKKDIILACAYPRLDVEVSKKMNHLLKAPFCVHPKTGKARFTYQLPWPNDCYAQEECPPVLDSRSLQSIIMLIQQLADTCYMLYKAYWHAPCVIFTLR